MDMIGSSKLACRFYFDFSATYVGVGMICPYIINISLFLGSIISWGILWPYIRSKQGVWYDASLPESSLHGINGYKVCINVLLRFCLRFTICRDGSYYTSVTGVHIHCYDTG